MPERITPETAAKTMGVKVQFIRKGLQENRFPFGWAVQTGTTGQWTYWIGKAAFEKATCLKVEGENT